MFTLPTTATTIKEWLAASNTFTTLIFGLERSLGVAVDGSGNVYIADRTSARSKWVEASNTVTTLVSSGLAGPTDVAVDGSGNVYIADTFNNAIKELPHAFVDAYSQSGNGGSGHRHVAGSFTQQKPT